MLDVRPRLSAIDLFCGAGGLSYGLQEAGIPVVAGVDLDPHCRYPFEVNIDAAFLEQDVSDLTADHLERLWIKDSVRVLAGCAPCQPFSPYRRGLDTSKEKQWPLLADFGRLAQETSPEILTMENVPRIRSSPVFQAFIDTLVTAGYCVDWRSCHGPDYGLPQSRRRLVLIASRLGPIKVPPAVASAATIATVGATIADLPPIEAGGQDPDDPLHTARALTDINLRRIKASTAGGTWALAGLTPSRATTTGPATPTMLMTRGPASRGASTYDARMGMSSYVRWLRQAVGDGLLLLPAVTAAVMDADERVLVIDHVHAGNWVLPGGAIEPKESPIDALRREVREETGLEVRPDSLAGVYGGPDFEVSYANGDRVAYVMALYRCGVTGGSLVLDDDEARAGRFVTRDEAEDLPLARWARILLDDCFCSRA